MMLILRRCRTLYDKGGMAELLRGIRDYIHIDLMSSYQDERNDNEVRWEFIKSHVNDNAQSLIDVGCAEGEFAIRAAEIGLKVTGFDSNVSRIRNAKKNGKKYSNLNFNLVELSPGTIEELPESDIILFLTVHHHWTRAYGYDDAANMFRVLVKKGRTIFYEPPGHMAIKESDEHGSLDPAESIEYYTQLIKSDFGDIVSITDTISVEYRSGTNRTDPMFVLESNK